MYGDKAAEGLFIEFAAGFKGKAQIFKTRGMHDELLPSNPEKTDDELAAFPEGDSYLWRLLSRADWLVVRAQGIRTDLERLCVLNDYSGARILLESCHALMAA